MAKPCGMHLSGEAWQQVDVFIQKLFQEAEKFLYRFFFFFKHLFFSCRWTQHLYFIFMWRWGSNPALHACQESTLPLSYNPSPLNRFLPHTQKNHIPESAFAQGLPQRGWPDLPSVPPGHPHPRPPTQGWWGGNRQAGEERSPQVWLSHWEWEGPGPACSS